MKNTIKLMGKIFQLSDLSSKSSNKWELFEGRVRQACTEDNPCSFINKLALLMQATTLSYDYELVGKMLIEEGKDKNIVNWIRDNLKIATSLSMLANKDPEKFEEVINGIQNYEYRSGDVAVIKDFKPEIEITATLKTPMHHGSDESAGNSSLFRRMQVLADNGGIITLPFYSGNAVRGRMRDLIADHFTSSLGFKPSRNKPPYEIWFFYLLYCGGNLAKENDAEKKASKAAGNIIRGINLEARSIFRDVLPMLSLFGFALGNSLFQGRFSSFDLIPDCKETGKTDFSFNDLMGWEYLTRRDDLGSDAKGEDDANTSMIANSEIMKQGAVLRGGFSTIGNITSMEKSCLNLAIKLLQKEGQLGGSGRRGWGFCDIACAEELDSSEYEKYLTDNKDNLLEFLKEIGALKC